MSSGWLPWSRWNMWPTFVCGAALSCESVCSFIKPFHSFSPFPCVTCVLTLSVTLRIQNVEICSIVKPIIDCIHSPHPYPHTHTPLHTLRMLCIHKGHLPLTSLETSLLWRPDVPINHRSPRWSKKIHNRLIKGEAARKERKTQASSDEGNNSCTASRRCDDR